jgi:hypothetical protein
MYPARYQSYRNSYANEGKWGLTPTSPEAQAAAIEGLLRAEHTNRTEAGTAPPLPTQTTQPTQPTPTPPTGGAQGIEVQDTAPAPGPSDYRPRQQEPMQNNNP